MAIYPVQPKSYRVLDGRIKYYNTSRSRHYRRGDLPAAHVMGTPSNQQEWRALGDTSHSSLVPSKYTNRPLDTFVLKQLREKINERKFRAHREMGGRLYFEIEVDIGRSKDLNTLKELVRQSVLKSMTLDTSGVWNLVFLQSAIHELFSDDAFLIFGGNLMTNEKHTFFGNK